MDLSKWTLVDLKKTLLESGYLSDDIITAKFSHVNPQRTAVFTITYKDYNTGEIDQGNVYVFINQSGKLVADF